MDHKDSSSDDEGYESGDQDEDANEDPNFFHIGDKKLNQQKTDNDL